jgi:hypothetical protein
MAGLLVAEDGHDRLDPGASFCELGADSVTEPVGAHGGHPSLVEEPGGGACVSEGDVEEDLGG